MEEWVDVTSDFEFSDFGANFTGPSRSDKKGVRVAVQEFDGSVYRLKVTGIMDLFNDPVRGLRVVDAGEDHFRIEKRVGVPNTIEIDGKKYDADEVAERVSSLKPVEE